MRFTLAFLVITSHAFFLQAEEPSFKLTFGSNLGNIPLEINKINKNKKELSGIKINSWILKPNFFSFIGDKGNLNFSKENSYKEALYLKLKIKF